MSIADDKLRFELIQCLADGQFHSGQSLGNKLGISRMAVSKHIQSLGDWGLEVFSVQGRGYRLSHSMDLLSESALHRALPHRAILFEPIIDSTNQYLLNRIGLLPSGSVCLAEYQAAGRGRRGRKWHSPFGTNLYLSLYWCFADGMNAITGLSLVAGIALANALTALGAEDIKLKWPNDLYWQGRKLAGILVEMTGQVGRAAHVVIGIGLNISMVENPEIDQMWANLSQTCKKTPSKSAIACEIIERLILTLNEFEAKGFAHFIPQWQAYDHFYQQPVQVITSQQVIRGIAQGVNAQGALLLSHHGTTQSYMAGEVSLRPDAQIDH